MKSRKLDYINFEEVNTLLEGFNKATGFVTAILDLEGNVLSKSGWRKMCTEFHRINPETSANCRKSDTVLANKLNKNEKYHFYECLNGLVDVAVPVIINGEHVANLFSGQFFFNEPDREFFIEQADKYGFHKEEYLNALKDVPIVSEERVKVAMDFLLNMTQLISDITRKKLEQSQLNEALRKSEERARNTLDNLLEGVQIIGFDWRYTYLNHTAEVQNRRPNSDLLGNRYMDVWPGIENTRVFETIKLVLEKRLPRQIETEFEFPDGNVSWFDLSIQPVPEGVYILSLDLTERKRKEEQLFESEFRFSKLYENGPFGMVMANKDFRFKKANPAFCMIMGYSEAELQNLTFKDLTHPDDLTKDLYNIKKLHNKEISVYKTEKRYLRKDGQVIWGSLTVTGTDDSEGQFLYYLGIIEDITRRKNAEQKILQLNERISTAARASQVGIWDWDVKNNVLAWDDQMYVLYGLKKEDFTGAYEAWFNGIHPDDREFGQNETRLALIGEKEYNTEFRVAWHDGTIRYLKAKGEVFRNEIGEPVRMIGINYDITEQKKIDEKIREKDQQFRKLSANVPDMIYQFIRRTDGSYYVPVASEGIRNIFGCTPEDVLYDFAPIFRAIHHEDIDRVIHAIESSAEHMSSFNCEFRVHIPGREIQWIYSSSTPEKLSDGSITWYGFNVDITQKRLAEEALRNSEALLNEVGRIAQIGGWDFDPATGNSSWTEEVARIHDLDPKTPSSVPLSISYYSSRSKPVIEKAFLEVVEKAIPYDLELEIISAKGYHKWVRTIGRPVVENGKVIKVVGSFQDITDHKKAQEALRESEEKLSTIFDVLPIGISLIDNNRGVARMNPVLERIIKLSYEDITVGKHRLRKYLRGDGSEMPPSEMASQLAIEENRVIQDVETGIETESGSVFWTSVSAAPLKVGGLSAVVITMDINARKHAEEALKLSEARYRNIFESAVIGIYRTSPDGKILMANPTLVKMLGFNSFDELAKRNLNEQGFEKQSLRNDFRDRILVNGSLTAYETEWKRADGSSVYVSENAKAFYSTNGELVYYEGTIEDITDRKKAETEIQKLNETLEERVEERTFQLKEANQELEAFSYSVSHDLRTPLRHINGFAEILTQEYIDQLPADAIKYLSIITDSAKKMGILIDDLLSFSRTGRTELKKSTFVMNKVIDDALAQIKLVIQDRNIVWKISSLPEVNCDYNLMRMVWINLIDNAVKYSRTKEKAVIQIGFKEEKNETVFFIKDNGAGFDMRYVNKLFGVFQRLHTPTQFEGTGIGLANVRRIILRHNGRTWAESKIEKGATFYFSIPKTTSGNQ